MKVFYEVEVLAVVPVSFMAQDTGDLVEYNKVYLLNTDDNKSDVLVFNTKSESISENSKGLSGIAEIEIDATGSKKPKLVDFKAK